MDLIFELLANVEEFLNKRRADDYDTYLAKIPLSHREKITNLFQYGAMFSALIFEVRRGGENMEKLKKEHFAVLEDAVKELKFVKHIV